MRERAGREAAETLGLRVLAWLVTTPAALQGFLTGSGIAPGDLRDRADDPQVLAAALDFLLAHEDFAAEFCTSEEIEARALHLARARLDGAP
jgi:hypothetical protein